jgi:hypothetical protein
MAFDEVEIYGCPKGKPEWSELPEMSCGYGFGCTDEDSRLHIAGDAEPFKRYLEGVERSDVDECRRVCELSGSCRGFQWYDNKCFFRRSTTCAKKVSSPFRDCYELSFPHDEHSQDEVTWEDEFSEWVEEAGSGIEDLWSSFAVTEDCYPSHLNNYDYQCRDHRGDFAELTWTQEVETKKVCIHRDMAYAQDTECDYGHNQGIVGIFAQKQFIDEYKHHRRHKKHESEDMALVNHEVFSATDCQEICRNLEKDFEKVCNVFWFEEADEYRDNILNRCYLYNGEHTTCSHSRDPFTDRKGSYVGWVGRNGC